MQTFYATHALEYLKANRGRFSNYEEGALAVLETDIPSSIKFRIPENGASIPLSDGAKMDEFARTYATPFRLPYPVVTLEYSCADEYFTNPDGLKFRKVVLVAAEAPQEEIDSCVWDREKYPGTPVAVISMYETTVMGANIWCVNPLVALIRPDGNYHWKPCIKGMTPDSYLSIGGDPNKDLASEQIAVLTFIAAMGCCNVSTEDAPPPESLNKARVKRGKVPFFTYKELVIDGPASPSGELGGTHASPRTHLRRGHIRRLPKGNVWVNACVVHGATPGFVAKDYRVA